MFAPRPITDAIDKVARQAIGKDWGIYAALIGRWQDIVGREYAEVTTPVKISFPYQPNEPRRRNGTLTVRLPKGLAMEFTFKMDIIRQRINAYFGYDAIGRIMFDSIHAPPPAGRTPAAEPKPEALETIKSVAQSVEDTELRAALEALGEGILRSNARE